jgi:hypothetical protein
VAHLVTSDEGTLQGRTWSARRGIIWPATARSDGARATPADFAEAGQAVELARGGKKMEALAWLGSTSASGVAMKNSGAGTEQGDGRILAVRACKRRGRGKGTQGRTAQRGQLALHACVRRAR